jgi:hypothetical protein
VPTLRISTLLRQGSCGCHVDHDRRFRCHPRRASSLLLSGWMLSLPRVRPPPPPPPPPASGAADASVVPVCSSALAAALSVSCALGRRRRWLSLLWRRRGAGAPHAQRCANDRSPMLPHVGPYCTAAALQAAATAHRTVISILRIAQLLTIFLHLNRDWSPRFSRCVIKTAGFEPKRPEI